eukprot:TRINITY_DN6992_c0_g1_i1.p1 TRINITY_DN6992_c0_g1~~TRINITY_DN6992_c0_g1_i1.p1  ORF type:complete len:504 (+),score=73.29 TRINITY_DN6992_c0_g1_i1:40-1551(+)
MKLEVATNGSTTTCFVALPPLVANTIYNDNPKTTSLVCELTWVDYTGQGHRKVVGWGGATSTSNELIEVPEALARCLSLAPQQTVEVRVLPNVAAATRVHVEPVSHDDWEIVELHQEYLEGEILNQINVACEGQMFPLWIRRQMVIHFQIVSSLPASCVRLVRDTEVVIAPKPRAKRKPQGDKEEASTTVFTPAPVNHTHRGSQLAPRRLRIQDMSPTVILEQRQQIDAPVLDCVFLNPHDFLISGLRTSDIVIISSCSSASPSTSSSSSHHTPHTAAATHQHSASYGANSIPAERSERSGTDALMGTGLTDYHSNAQQPKRTFVRVYTSEDTEHGHVMVPALLRDTLGLGLHTWARLLPSHYCPPIKFSTITLRPLSWLNPNGDEPSSSHKKDTGQSLSHQIDQAAVISAFNDWVKNVLDRLHDEQAASAGAIPLTQGSVISLPVQQHTTATTTPTTTNFVLHFDVPTVDRSTATGAEGSATVPPPLPPRNTSSSAEMGCPL